MTGPVDGTDPAVGSLALATEPAAGPGHSTSTPARATGHHRWQAARRWGAYLASRAAGAVAVIAVIIVLTFMIVRWVPGDPARNIVGLSAGPEQVRQVREQLGLTQPFWHQFGAYLSGLVHGDLGNSFVNQQPITAMIAQRLPLTAELAGSALVIVLIIGFPLGILAGVLQRNGRGRTFTSSFAAGSSLLGALPEYITGTLLILLLSLSLHWLPVQGGPGFTSMLMPAISVGLAPGAVLARLVRNETVAVLSQEYITTATSKRLPSWRLILRHVLPNVVTSTLTLGGLLLVALLGGTVITENVFNISGLGTEIVQAILHSDYPAVQGIILLLGAIAVAINIVVDVVLGLLDPRVLSRRPA